MKNTLLADLIKIYDSLKCAPLPEHENNRCLFCQNKLICKTISDLINSIMCYYEEE